MAVGPDGNFLDAKIACFGIAFKADIDDLRESPALEIVTELAQVGFEIAVVEPNIHELPEKLKMDRVRLTDARDAIESSDVVVMLVDHKHFKELTIGDLSGKQLVDTRGVFSR